MSLIVTGGMGDEGEEGAGSAISLECVVEEITSLEAIVDKVQFLTGEVETRYLSGEVTRQDLDEHNLVGVVEMQTIEGTVDFIS